MRVYPAGSRRCIIQRLPFFFSSAKKVMPIVKLTDYETRRAKTARTKNAPIKSSSKIEDNSHIPVLCIGAVVTQRFNVAFFFKSLQHAMFLVIVALFYVLFFLSCCLTFFFCIDNSDTYMCVSLMKK